jgi:arylsulfatase A
MTQTINRRDFIKSTGTSAALSLTGVGCGQKDTRTENERLPNIIVILADDMGYGDPGCNNPQSKISTPNIDRLAAEGLSFTDAHSPSAVCTPTRYGLLTGRYCWRTHLKNGVLWGYSPNLIEPGRLTVPSLLKRTGYTTGCIGKWHLGFGSDEKVDYSKQLSPGPNDHGFDYFYGIPASLDMDPYLYVENDRAVDLPTDTTEGKPMPEFYRGGAIAPGLKIEDILPTLTRKAVSFIENQAETHAEQPFFLYFPLTAPHTPWVPNEQFRGKSRAGVYGDFVTEVDWTVGQVLDTLDRLGITDETLIVFTSDNGAHEDHIGEEYGHDANRPWRGQKADIWDGGHRIPFFARWPGKIERGTSSGETFCLTDFLHTFAALTGEELPDSAGEDSYNMLPALLGEDYAGPIREATVHHSVHGMFSIRHGDWKLILGRGSGGFHWSEEDRKPPPDAVPYQLYNVHQDSAETVNLYGDRPDIVDKLTALLETYKAQGHSRPMS